MDTKARPRGYPRGTFLGEVYIEKPSTCTFVQCPFEDAASGPRRGAMSALLDSNLWAPQAPPWDCL